jgi:hypothetical protein
MTLIPRLRAGPVRPVFRACAWVLGPLLLAGGSLMLVLDLRGVSARGWPDWSRQVHTGLWLGIGNVALGWMLLSAARTGRDPYVSQETDPRNEQPRS